MSKKIALKIPEPCHENWNRMTTVEQGRFCHSCAKTVIDFSVMTDDEILDHFSKSTGNVCGRFMTKQLNRSIDVPGHHRKRYSWQYVWNMLLAMFLHGSAANAQQNPLQGKVAVTAQQARPLQQNLSGGFDIPKPKRLAVKLIDEESNQPVAFATVTIPERNLTIVTDSVGVFDVPGSLPDQEYTIEISSIGYETTTISSKRIRGNNSQQHLIILQRDSTKCLPGVVYTHELETIIAGGAFSVQRVTGFDFIKDTLTSFFVDRTVNIFPNPVASGSIMQVRLNLKRLGKYEMIITNSSGQILSSEIFDFVVKNQVRPFLVPAKYRRGFYFIRIQGTDKKEFYSKKFLVK